MLRHSTSVMCTPRSSRVVVDQTAPDGRTVSDRDNFDRNHRCVVPSKPEVGCKRLSRLSQSNESDALPTSRVVLRVVEVNSSKSVINRLKPHRLMRAYSHTTKCNRRHCAQINNCKKLTCAKISKTANYTRQST